MHDSTASSRSKFLPAIFQKAVRESGGPLAAILSTFDELVAGVEMFLEPERGSCYFDPDLFRWPAGDEGNRARCEREWINWLATWVCLPMDQDPIQRNGGAVETQGHQPDVRDRGIPGEDNGLDTPEYQWGQESRRIIADAVSLHKRRGTVDGLKRMLETFYGVKADIRERSWPRGLEIGTHSTIGVQTFIQNPPHRSRAFVVLLEVEILEFPREDLGDLTGDWINTPLLGAADGAIARTYVFSRQEKQLQKKKTDKECEDEPPQGILGPRIEKVIEAIYREKPAHISCYIAFKGKPRQAPKPLSPCEIGIHSEIGEFVILMRNIHED